MSYMKNYLLEQSEQAARRRGVNVDAVQWFICNMNTTPDEAACRVEKNVYQLLRAAIDTGYDFKFLYEMYIESIIDDNENPDEAASFIDCVAREMDF